MQTSMPIHQYPSIVHHNAKECIASDAKIATERASYRNVPNEGEHRPSLTHEYPSPPLNRNLSIIRSYPLLQDSSTSPSNPTGHSRLTIAFPPTERACLSCITTGKWGSSRRTSFQVLANTKISSAPGTSQPHGRPRTGRNNRPANRRRKEVHSKDKEKFFVFLFNRLPT